MISFGTTGIIIPNPITSMRMVMKIKPIAACLDAAILTNYYKEMIYSFKALLIKKHSYQKMRSVKIQITYFYAFLDKLKHDKSTIRLRNDRSRCNGPELSLQ